MTTWITICHTCKREGRENTGQTDGETLAELVEARAAGCGIRTRRVACLMGCTHACNVAIQAPGKLAYTLGNFIPDAEAAQGIVDYAGMHRHSETGRVPFREWPQAIKGHFITRHPPLPEEEE